jgi:DNA-binding ferritin-like protein
MPISHKSDGWYWGSQGPFPTKQKALQVGQAAHASGYQEEEQMNLESTSLFVNSLMHSAAVAHALHFQVTGEGSDAAHRALQSYYEEIPELVDSVAESIQGAYGQLIPPYKGTFINTQLDPLEYMKNLQQFVRTERKTLPQDSEIQNEVDAISGLLNSTVYRLKFLR